MTNRLKGTVYKSTGSWYSVKTNDAIFYNCRIRGLFRLKGIQSTNPVAVGDKVIFDVETESDPQTGVICDIEERKNYLIRKSVNLSKQIHIIAANIDQVFLLITLNNPPTFTSFIDRFLITTEAYGIKTILLFNKLDTYDKDTIQELKHLISVYSKIGYPCTKISVKTGFNIDKVKQEMIAKVSMFCGHSGVGKSSLVNAIEPALNLKTKQLSEHHMQGKHATTFAEMFDLSFNARIIDTPGIKGFGVVDIDEEELANYFPEFFKLKSKCKFNNCLHLKEPKCAVKNALKKGEIYQSRYSSYIQILKNDDENYRTDYWE